MTDADCFADQLQGQVKGEGPARHAVPCRVVSLMAGGQATIEHSEIVACDC